MSKINKFSLFALASALLAQDPLSAVCGPWGCGVGGGGGYNHQPYYPSQPVYHQSPNYYPQAQGRVVQYQGQQVYSAPQQSRYKGRPYKQAQMRAARNQSYYQSIPVEDHSFRNNQPFGQEQYIEQQAFSGPSYYQSQPPVMADDDLVDDQGYYQPGQDQQYFSGQRLNAPRNAQVFHQGEQDFDQAPAYQPGRGPQAFSRGNGGFRNYEAATPQSYPLEEPDFRQNQNFRQNPQNRNFIEDVESPHNQNIQSYRSFSQPYSNYSQTTLYNNNESNDPSTGRATTRPITNRWSNNNTNNGSSWSGSNTGNTGTSSTWSNTGTGNTGTSSWSNSPNYTGTGTSSSGTGTGSTSGSR